MQKEYPDLEGLTVRQLKEFCKERRIAGYSKYPRKADLLAFVEEWIGAIAADCESEEGGDAPQVPNAQPLDVACPVVPAGNGKTPDIVPGAQCASTTPGVLDPLTATYPNEVGSQWRLCLPPHLLYSADALGELPHRLFYSSSTLRSKQKSPQATDASASWALLALPWGDFRLPGAVPIASVVAMGGAAPSIAAAGGSCPSTCLPAMGGPGLPQSPPARTSPDLRGITSARKSQVITGPSFQQVMDAGSALDISAANPSHYPRLTQSSYMDMAVVGHAKRAIANPVRAP